MGPGAGGDGGGRCLRPVRDMAATSPVAYPPKEQLKRNRIKYIFKERPYGCWQVGQRLSLIIRSLLLLVVSSRSGSMVGFEELAVKLFIARIHGHCLFKGLDGLLITVPVKKSIGQLH